MAKEFANPRVSAGRQAAIGDLTVRMRETGDGNQDTPHLVENSIRWGVVLNKPYVFQKMFFCQRESISGEPYCHIERLTRR